MSYIALYRKYRPRTFKDVIGQDTTVKILKNSIKDDKIGHAYIFSGPRGTGKTSIAKIFARAVNCLSPKDGDICGKCENCINLKENDTDIIEIDAASNNGVDEIREIRNNTKLMPNIGKYKIYIIDEVHMLSTGAFNALLKTLEEPPSHVIFILATTEIQKIPLTILSRCQRFDFHKINEETMKKRLKEILKEENQKVDESILDLIVKLSDGCCRDAINLLDQILSIDGNINENDIYDLAGDVKDEIVFNLLDYIINSKYEEGLELIQELVDSGKNILNIVNKMLIILRNVSISKHSSKKFDKKELEEYKSIDIDEEKIFSLTKILLEFNNELKKSTMQKLLFEIYFLQMCNLFSNNYIKSKKVEEDIVVDKTEKPIELETVNDEPNNILTDKLTNLRIGNVLSKADKNILIKVQEEYKNVDEYSSNKTFNNACSILEDSKIAVASDEYLLITFKYESNVSLFKKNISEVEELLKKVLSKKYKLVGLSDKDWEKIKGEYIKDRSKFKYVEEENVEETNSKPKTEDADEYDAVFDIFGEDAVTIK